MAFFSAVATCTVTVGWGSLSFCEEHPQRAQTAGISMAAMKNVHRILRIIVGPPSCMIKTFP
jgi:hypothetical protein